MFVAKAPLAPFAELEGIVVFSAVADKLAGGAVANQGAAGDEDGFIGPFFSLALVGAAVAAVFPFNDACIAEVVERVEIIGNA